jgi:hypothetical protein
MRHGVRFGLGLASTDRLRASGWARIRSLILTALDGVSASLRLATIPLKPELDGLKRCVKSLVFSQIGGTSPPVARERDVPEGMKTEDLQPSRVASTLEGAAGVRGGRRIAGFPAEPSHLRTTLGPRSVPRRDSVDHPFRGDGPRYFVPSPILPRVACRRAGAC